jgi:hypothetical protein
MVNIENSHTELLAMNGIKDNCKDAKFVRVEYVPIDGDVCNKDKSNWELIVDQDFIPDWFDTDKAINQMWRALNDTWDNVFLIQCIFNRPNDRRAKG